jgi:hypothetical protein
VTKLLRIVASFAFGAILLQRDSDACAGLRSARGAIAGVGPLDAIAAAMGHVEECDP